MPTDTRFALCIYACSPERFVIAYRIACLPRLLLSWLHPLCVARSCPVFVLVFHRSHFQPRRYRGPVRILARAVAVFGAKSLGQRIIVNRCQVTLIIIIIIIQEKINVAFSPK